MGTIETVSFKTIVSDLERAEPYLVGHEEQDDYRCAVLLLAALQIGTSIEQLTHFTKYPRQFVSRVYERMQEAELWVGDQVRCDHWKREDKVSFDVDFWMDVLVAYGSWAREPDTNGGYEYFQIGPEPADEILVQ